MKNLSFLFFLFFIPAIYAANLSERNLGIENSDYLKKQIREFFYEENSLSESKIREFEKQNIRDKEEEIKMLTDNFRVHEGLSIEDAHAKALEDKKIVSINYILANLELLKNTGEPERFGYELKNILRVYFALKREARDAVFQHGMKSLGSMIFHKHNVPVNDLKKKMPSNLVNLKEERFFNHVELEEMVKEGEDISLIDPVNSSFWNKPENIPQIDPISKMEKEGKIPSVFKYKEILTREGHPKIEVTEKSVDGTKRKWKLKFGREVNIEVFNSRFLNLLGYYSDEYYYVKNPKVYFKNKKEYEDMLIAWIDYYNSGLDVKPARYTKETGEDDNGFFAIFYEGLLEARPKSDIRVGNFHVTEMGNWERREVRALLLLMAFINNPDFKPSRNNKVKLIAEGDDPTSWKVQELVHDLGFGIGGQFISNAPNEFKWSFLQRKGNILKVAYTNNQWIRKERNPFQQATYSDLKWSSRYLAQITQAQFEKFVLSAGWPEPVGKLNLEKIKRRRNEVVKAFNLQGKIVDGNLIELWPEVDPETFSWGEFIKNGKLTKEYKPEGYPIDYLKINFEPEQIVGITELLMGPLLDATGNIPYNRMASFPQDVSGIGFQKLLPGFGIGFRFARQVEANRNAIDENKSWITFDTLDIFGDIGVTGIIPVTPGLEAELKIKVLIGKQFRISYYSPTHMKAMLGNPKLIAELPFKKKKIIENLQLGQSYSDGLFVELQAREGIQTTGLVGIGTGLKQQQIFLNYTNVTKAENNIMEVSKVKSKSFNFSVSAYLKLIEFLKIDLIKAGIEFGDKNILTYHFDLGDSSSFDEKQAFHMAAFTNKDDPYFEKIPTSKSEIKFYNKFWLIGAFATIGGKTSGIYNISEGVDGNISRSFDYQTSLEKRTPSKSADYKLLGHFEFKDEAFNEITKQNISLEYEYLAQQMSFKEINKERGHINGLVNDKTFFQYTPEFHASNHLGKIFFNLRFDLKDEALSCIFEKINCLAKGPSASQIDKKLINMRNKKNPIKRIENLGPWLTNTLAKPESFKDFLQFIGGDKISTEFWMEGDVLNEDRFLHLKKERLTI